MKILAFSISVLLLTAFFGSALLVNTLIHYQKSTTHCVKSVMQVQDSVRIVLENLLSLNPKARTLRRRHKFATARLAKAIASNNPAAIAAAKAHLSLIVKQRHQLAARQKFLILKAQNSNRGSGKTITDAMKPVQVQVSTPVFRVDPDLPDIAPAYEVPNDFKDAQEIRVTWIFKPDEQWPSSLQRSTEIFLGQRRIYKREYRCAASIEPRGHKYRPTITNAGDNLG